MFRVKIKEHGSRVETLLKDYPEIANIEASTKGSLINPLLRCLGYDTGHPQQVALEVLTELGGRIDYVLTGGTNAKIAVEAKKAGVKLSKKETNQLRSYFTFSEAVAAILTNGIDVWIFTDLDKANVMDAEPYLTVDIRNVTDNDIHHLQTLTRMQVNPTAIHEQAQRERYRTQVNTIVAEELAAPSQEFLRMVGKKAGIKPLTKALLESLQPLVAEAIHQHLSRPIVSKNIGSDPQPQPPDSHPGPPPITAGKKAAKTLRHFKGATLFGQSLPVKNYTQLLIEVAKELRTRHPDGFAELVQQAPFFKPDRKWQWISMNRADMYPDTPTRMVGDFFFDVGMSAKDKEKRAALLLKGLGYDPAELVVHTSGE